MPWEFGRCALREDRVGFRSRIGAALLLAACGIGPVSVAHGQQGCQIDEAQRLTGALLDRLNLFRV